jgi:ATP-dependent exoDNAse (exonuclease V) alpha subunit
VNARPGTGKSYTALAIAKAALDNGKTVVMTAFTHKAVNRLYQGYIEMFPDAESQPTFCTLHRFVGARLFERKNKDATTKLVTSLPPVISQFPDVLIVDEISMVPAAFTKLFAKSMEYAKSVIGFGDDQQLPPVKESKSSFFELEGFERVELTQNMRTRKLSGLFDKLSKACPRTVLANSDDCKKYTLEALIKAYAEAQDPNSIFLSYTRASAKRASEAFRKVKFQCDDLPRFVRGDLVWWDGEPQKIVDIERHTASQGFQYLIIRLDTGECVRTPDLTREELIKEYGPFATRGYVFLDYAYATTVHKAQGSQWPCVYLDVKKAPRKVVFVGATRAQETLHVAL